MLAWSVLMVSEAELDSFLFPQCKIPLHFDKMDSEGVDILFFTRRNISFELMDISKDFEAFPYRATVLELPLSQSWRNHNQGLNILRLFDV